jgi:hypothetical protein
MRGARRKRWLASARMQIQGIGEVFRGGAQVEQGFRSLVHSRWDLRPTYVPSDCILSVWGTIRPMPGNPRMVSSRERGPN